MIEYQNGITLPCQFPLHVIMNECPNSRQVHQRSAVALHTKLQNMDMSKVPLFKTLLYHERNSQDGFLVLYAMLCVCHPKLVEKPKLEAPVMENNDNILTFVRKYSNYIECEKNFQQTLFGYGTINLHHQYIRY